MGRIRTAKGKETYTDYHGVRVWKQRILKPKTCKRKTGGKFDQRVELWKDGLHSNYLVARLVASAWIPCDDPNLTVNHKDGNPLNNKIDNLEWVTLEENIHHGIENGFYDSICIKCFLRDETGKVTEYPSLSAASRALGKTNRYISNAMRKGANIYGRENKRYEIISPS